jgi:hypothetical protein
VADRPSLFLQYDLIAREYRGWSLTEIRALSARERRYWCDLIIARLKNQSRDG